MPKSTITFRIPDSLHKAVDELAEVLGRDRTFVITQALEAYVEVHRWQLEHVEAAAAEADAGQNEVAEKVAQAMSRWRR